MKLEIGKGERHAASDCPRCGRRLDTSTGVNGAVAPSAGDVNVCAYCAAVLVYADDAGRVREPTAAEMGAIRAWENWPVIERVREAVRLAGG